MAEKYLDLEIITPEDIVYQGEVKLLIVPGALGRLGILPGHASLITTIEKGKIMLRLSEKEDLFMEIGDGLLEVYSDELSLLVDCAHRVSEDNLTEEEVTEIAKVADKA